MTRPISTAGLTLIKSFEGLLDGDPSTVLLDPYLDPVGIWTIGYGHAIRWNKRLLRGTADRGKATELYPGGISLEQADTLLQADVLDTCRDVEVVTDFRPLGDNQFAALVSFAYNCGASALKRSTLLKKFQAGDVAGAAAEFGKWNKAGGQALAGLTRRRAAERELFLLMPNAKIGERPEPA